MSLNVHMGSTSIIKDSSPLAHPHCSHIFCLPPVHNVQAGSICALHEVKRGEAGRVHPLCPTAATAMLRLTKLGSARVMQSH